ncbi:MAG: O-methyltransferase StaMB [Acidobacteriota bacterium]|nr:O-methyltransferase StaMB [Acidobacteriota bacterium]
MTFESRLFRTTRLGRYGRCVALIEANSKCAPLWERVCLALFVGIGPPLARLFGVNTCETWSRAERILEEVLAVTQASPEEIAALLREYVKLRSERDDHLPVDEAREGIYDRSFYPVVTHFTYALQPSATARLNFINGIVSSMRAGHARVADLGCGSGVILTEILAMKPHWFGKGLDISEASVKYARRLAAHKKVEERAEFRVGNIADLPFDDESLDLVVASEIIEHMAEPELVVAEIARVLRPGGKVVLTMPIQSHTPAHIHSLSNCEDLRDLCEAAGLSVRRLEPRWHFGFGDDRRHVFALAEATLVSARIRTMRSGGWGYNLTEPAA